MTPQWLPTDGVSLADAWEIIHDTPFGYVVFARKRWFDKDRPGGVEFGITAHVCSETDGTGRQYGNGMEALDADPTTAPLAVSGWIKWDGCSHTHWGEYGNEEPGPGYLHICGGDSWDDMIAALSAVRAYAKAFLPDFGCAP